ncbi:hypothetical protein AlacWU_03232 [Aspergillus niger]|nr:hypothetical protein AlacWU_03232 [Aspergillus niger]
MAAVYTEKSNVTAYSNEWPINVIVYPGQSERTITFSLVQVIALEATNEVIKAQLQGSTKVSDRRAERGV